MASGVPQCAIDLIKESESFRAEAYPDPRVGWDVPTIGYGTTRYPDGSQVQQGDVITLAEAEEFLKNYVEKRCRPALENIPTWEQMNENQRGALYSFAYNLGEHFYGGANFQSITRVCDSTDRWDDAEWVAEQFVKYRNPGSNVEEGLRRRRLAEAELFCTHIA